MRWIWMIVLAGVLGACSGSASEPVTPPPTPEAEPTPEPPPAPVPAPAATATLVGSCTIAEFGSCQTFYSDNPLAASAASQCADNAGIWSDVCVDTGALARCITPDGRPLAAFYPPQPVGDFSVGCAQLGGQLVP
jgi:hypothetical protein